MGAAGPAVGPFAAPALRRQALSAPKWLAWKFRVGRAPTRSKASRLPTVPSSRYFAVAGPAARRRSLGLGREAGPIRNGRLDVPVDDQRFQARNPSRRRARRALVPTVRRDRREADEAFAGDTDRRDASFAREGRRRLRRRAPPGPVGRSVLATHSDGSAQRPPTIASTPMRLPAIAVAAREGITDEARERRLRDDRELRARRESCPDERGEREDERRLGRERIEAGA